MLVGNDIIAHEGDYVVVAGNVVISTYTGPLPPRTEEHPMFAHFPTSAPAAQLAGPGRQKPKAIPLPAPRPAPAAREAKPQTPPKARQMSPRAKGLDQLTPAMAFDAVRDLGGVARFAAISDKLGLEPDDTPFRQRLWRILNMLCDDMGVLSRVRVTGIKGIKNEYSIVPDAPQTGAELPDLGRVSPKDMRQRARVQPAEAA